ncbi:hypothetical protein [Flavobacterium sp.]|uniref:hypothetical protein n=1 Tax=Flavobacterium sp. TaxID=239 RepID=UPI00374D91FB
MLKNTLICCITILLFYACNRVEKQKNNDTAIITDTLENIKTVEDNKKLESEIRAATIYPVYNLAQNTTAIVITMFENDKESQFEKIFVNIRDTDSLEADYFHPLTAKFRKFEYYDTLGIVHLIKSEKLEKEIKKIIEPKYYVYGTKGFSEVSVDEVLCRIDDCKENFIALTLKNFDEQKNGKPLFCSTKPLKLNYGKNYYQIQTKIQKMDDSIVYRYSDVDSTKTKVYANIGSALFIYNDDFLWGKNIKKSKSKFPERRILIQQKNNKFKTIWIEGLDLFGYRCD